MTTESCLYVNFIKLKINEQKVKNRSGLSAIIYDLQIYKCLKV